MGFLNPNPFSLKEKPMKLFKIKLSPKIGIFTKIFIIKKIKLLFLKQKPWVFADPPLKNAMWRLVRGNPHYSWHLHF